MARRIRLIVNPAAGSERAVLRPLNRVLNQADVDWEMRVTRGRGDGLRLAREAVQAGVDAVVAYGGDGTMMEMAGALAGTGVPLGIIPGGRANILAVEMGVPMNPERACELAVREPGRGARLRAVDVGRLLDRQDERFVVRVGIGYEAEMVIGARRGPGLLGSSGRLGYWLSALRALRQRSTARYRVTLDGRTEEAEGVQCIVTNAGNVGRQDLRVAEGIDASDGQLDVVVSPTAGPPDLLAAANSLLVGRWRAEVLHHWQAREVTVEADPPQPIEVDGEPCGTTPIRMEALPRALHVLVPA